MKTDAYVSDAYVSNDHWLQGQTPLEFNFTVQLSSVIDELLTSKLKKQK